MSSNNAGKTIKRIVTSKKKVIIKFDDEKLAIPLNVFTKFYLYEGKTLSDDDINVIASLCEEDKYLEFAKKSLNASFCSTKTMRQKLIKKGANEKQVDAIINELTDYKLLDDERYIYFLIDSLINKNYGNKRIMASLINRGFSNEDILHSLSSFSGERERAKNFIPKLEKKYSSVNYASKKKKIYLALIHYGYGHDVASEALNELKKCNHDHELMLLALDYKKRITKLEKRDLDDKEMNRRIINYLLGKGYQYKDIIKVKEEIDNESRMD